MIKNIDINVNSEIINNVLSYMKNQEMTGKLPLFDGTNFGFWKKRMSYYLMSVGPKVWNVVLNGYNAPPTFPLIKMKGKCTLQMPKP